MSYLDPYGKQAYAYFSAGRKGYGNDCPSLGLQPYAGAPGAFLNPQGFQIISAGRDGKFGRGGAGWAPAGAATFYPRADPGRDDWSNFHDRPLGVP